MWPRDIQFKVCSHGIPAHSYMRFDQIRPDRRVHPKSRRDGEDHRSQPVVTSATVQTVQNIGDFQRYDAPPQAWPICDWLPFIYEGESETNVNKSMQSGSITKQSNNNSSRSRSRISVDDKVYRHERQ